MLRVAIEIAVVVIAGFWIACGIAPALRWPDRRHLGVLVLAIVGGLGRSRAGRDALSWFRAHWHAAPSHHVYEVMVAR